MKLLLGVLCALFLAALVARAEAPQVSFDVQVSRSVANDWAVAQLSATDSDADPVALAVRPNRRPPPTSR